MTPLLMTLLSSFGTLIAGYAARHFNILNHTQAANPPTGTPATTPTIPASSPLTNGVTVAPASSTTALLSPNHPVMAQLKGKIEGICSQLLEAIVSQIQAPVIPPVQVVTPPPNPFLVAPANVTVTAPVAVAPAVVAQVAGTSQVVSAGS